MGLGPLFRLVRILQVLSINSATYFGTSEDDVLVYGSRPAGSRESSALAKILQPGIGCL